MPPGRHWLILHTLGRDGQTAGVQPSTKQPWGRVCIIRELQERTSMHAGVSLVGFVVVGLFFFFLSFAALFLSKLVECRRKQWR